ncbi:MAG: tetratricopeptide repeat protein [Bacteroidales bacterium]|nr:tetratricopeptide repeat protein [Bacteroidales bacterium]
MRLIRKITGILVVYAAISTNLNAQTRSDVIAAYNEGAKTVQTDVKAAIDAFERTIALADKVGAEAADLKEKAIKVLPGLYIKVAADAINQKKPLPEIMKAAKSAVAITEKYGSQSQKENASRIMVQAYNMLATDYFNNNDLDNALLTFDSLLAINPDYVNAIYNKSLIYLKQNNADAFEQTIDIVIEKLKSANDTARVRQISLQALEYFRAAGSMANQSGKLDEALTLLNKAAKYGDDKDLFYYFSDVYNKQKNFSEGEEYAKRGLALETGTPEAKAKFYFQIGIAQAGKGQTAEACASFKNAMFGQFAEPSKVMRTNLKCQ